MVHDAPAQIAYVSAECFLEFDGCDDALCNCCCHELTDEIDGSSVDEAVSRALAR